jgi:hypothetical protein
MATGGSVGLASRGKRRTSGGNDVALSNADGAWVSWTRPLRGVRGITCIAEPPWFLEATVRGPE